MPWAPSFTTPFGAGARLYPAEAVGTAIEVKSNITDQWEEVKRTAVRLDPLRQKLSGITVKGGKLKIEDETIEPIPLYAVGYEGWSKADTVKKKLCHESLDGILILKQKIFAWSDRKAYLLRLQQCQAELTKVDEGTSNKSMAACARAVNLMKDFEDLNVIVSQLNEEDWSLTPIHFGDEEYLPHINAKCWTLKNFESFRKVFLQKTKVATGIDAILQFVSVVHQEVGKRSAMSFDLFDYAL